MLPLEIGELENWRIGDLENWSKLEHWRIGAFENETDQPRAESQIPDLDPCCKPASLDPQSFINPSIQSHSDPDSTHSTPTRSHLLPMDPLQDSLNNLRSVFPPPQAQPSSAPSSGQPAAQPNIWEEELDFFGMPDANRMVSALSGMGRKDGDGLSEEERRNQKRRAAVAAASRATRAKRKKELEDLKKKNQDLEREKEQYLDKIAELQMQVQTKRDSGAVDLSMENELLRAELNEHKNFISMFKSVADGVPTTASAKRVICMQGADTAVAQVLGLLSTSLVDPSWKQGRIRNYPGINLMYQRLPHGSRAEEAKRVTLRVDVPHIPRDAEGIMRSFYKTWCNADLSERLSNHFGEVSKEIKEIDTGLDELDQTPDQEIRVYYYREKRTLIRRSAKGKGKNKSKAAEGKGGGAAKRAAKRSRYSKGPVVNTDTLLLLTSKKTNVPLSSFLPFSRNTPAPTPGQPLKETQTAATGQGHGQSQTVGAAPGVDSSSKEGGTTGGVPAYVVASTSTQHNTEIQPVQPGVHRIRSVLLEGVVLRPVDGGTLLSAIYSYPLKSTQSDEEETEFLSERHASGWVDDDGFMTDVCEASLTELIKILAEDQNLDLKDMLHAIATRRG